MSANALTFAPIIVNPTGATTGRIPDGVRLQLDLAPGEALVGRITRDWVSPLLGGGKS